MKDNLPLRIGLAGYGYWGPNLVRNFRSLDDCCVTHICDVDVTRLSQAARRHPGIRATHHFEDLTKDPDLDAIIISVPTALHYELGMQSLLAGKHTFIEKPLADAVDKGEDLVATAHELSLTLMVGHTFVYSAPVRRTREIIRSGEIGDVIYINAQRLNLGLLQPDINVVWDLAPHDISILLYLLQETPSSVGCQGKVHYLKGIEDVAGLWLHFPSGAFAMIQTSWLDPCKTRLINIVGSRKMIRYDDTEPLEKIKVYDKCVERGPYYTDPGQFQLAYHYGDMYAPWFDQPEPLKVECQHFLECIRTGAPSISGGTQALQVLRVLEAASISLRDGGKQVPITGGAKPALSQA
jgi:predicted dehydrogenase